MRFLNSVNTGAGKERSPYKAKSAVQSETLSSGLRYAFNMAIGFPPSSPRTDAQSQKGVLLVLELLPLLFVSETKSRQSLIHEQNQIFFCVMLGQRRRWRRVLATGGGGWGEP